MRTAMFSGRRQRACSLDCSPDQAGTLEGLLRLVGAAAAARPPGEWIDGINFDESLISEGRFPTRRELDAAAPLNPVRIRHGGGHAIAVNTLGRDALGLEPPTDDDTGCLVDPVCSKPGPRRRQAEIEAEVGRMSREWLSFGTTFLHDVGLDNEPSDIAALRALVRSRTILQRLGALVRPPLVTPDPVSSGMQATREHVEVSGVKLAIEESTMSSRTLAALEAEIRRQCGASRTVAIHIVEIGALAAVMDVLTRLKGEGIDLEQIRLEHVSICPPEWGDALASLGVTVVTQPAFLYERGDRYQRLVERGEHHWLYPTAELLQAGVKVAGSSDSPVGPPNPYAGMAAAIQRRSRTGRRFAGTTGLERRACLELYTVAGARAVARPHDLGRLAVAYLADFAILDRDPMTVPIEDLPHTRAVATYVNGRCVHDQGWLKTAGDP